MDKENKYYNLIESLVRNHRKFPGHEAIMAEIIDDVYSHSEVIINTIDNEAVIESYLEKVIATSIITVPKKMNFNSTAKHRVISSAAAQSDKGYSAAEQKIIPLQEQTKEKPVIAEQNLSAQQANDVSVSLQEQELQTDEMDVVQETGVVADEQPEFKELISAEESDANHEIVSEENLELALEEGGLPLHYESDENSENTEIFSQNVNIDEPNPDLVVKMINSIDDNGMTETFGLSAEQNVSEDVVPEDEPVDYSNLENADDIDILNIDVDADILPTEQISMEESMPEIDLVEPDEEVQNGIEDIVSQEDEASELPETFDGPEVPIADADEQIASADDVSIVELENNEPADENFDDLLAITEDTDNDGQTLDIIQPLDEDGEVLELQDETLNVVGEAEPIKEETFFEKAELHEEQEVDDFELVQDEVSTDATETKELSLNMAEENSEQDLLFEQEYTPEVLNVSEEDDSDITGDISEGVDDIISENENLDTDNDILSEDEGELSGVGEYSIVDEFPENSSFTPIDGDDTEIELNNNISDDLDEGLELNLETKIEDSTEGAEENSDELPGVDDNESGLDLPDDYFANIAFVSSDETKARKEQNYKLIDYSVFDYSADKFSQPAEVDLIPNKLMQLSENLPEADVIKIFEMKYKQNLTISEIAAELKANKDTVISVVNKIVELL